MTTEIKNKPDKEVDEELSQSRARAAIAGLGTAALWINWYLYDVSLTTTLIVSAYWFFSIFWILLVKRKPGHFVVRRIISIIGDLGISSFTVSQSGPLGFAFYPIFLWIIVGNGVRFGQKYLFFALAVGVVGLSFVISTSEIWQENVYVSLGLLSGLIILPLFYLTMLNRLHSMNEQLKFQLAKTEYTATHDGLTALTNRRHFYVRLEDEIKWAERHQSVFAVIYIDLDGFKQINDTLSHQAGDQLLIKVGQILTSSVRETDVVARLGGDEFIILLRTNSELLRVEPVLDRVLTDLRATNEMFDHKMNVSASIGVSFYPANACTAEELISKADYAMYQAKNGGKNNYILYSNDDHDSHYSDQFNSPL